MEKATLGGGCFWCVESVYKRLDGVESAVSGYAGGETEDPSYREVCNGSTGHAEVVQVTFDPDVVTYEEILELFFTIHDPTQKNRQGPDVGTQYRSIILYHDESQRGIASRVIEELGESDDYASDIVTEVEPLDTFYRAEEKHQDYYEKHPDQPYCQSMIPPKIKKALKWAPDKIDERPP